MCPGEGHILHQLDVLAESGQVFGVVGKPWHVFVDERSPGHVVSIMQGKEYLRLLHSGLDDGPYTIMVSAFLDHLGPSSKSTASI